jgi:hypothetical protein
MATIEFTLKSQLPRTVLWTERLAKQVPWMVKSAMDKSGDKAKKALRAQMPRYIDRPVAWTRRSLISTKAHTNKLSIKIGFKDWWGGNTKRKGTSSASGGGTPAAYYLQPMAQLPGEYGKEPRRPKSSELWLRRSGVIRANQYLVPTGNKPLPYLKGSGNVSPTKYQQVISALRGYNIAGFTSNRSYSKRSQAKRAKFDVFLGGPGGQPVGVQARVGRTPRKWKPGGPGRPPTTKLKRGFSTIFHLVDRAPQYEQTFPVEKIAGSTFWNTFRTNLFDAVEAETRYQKARANLT